jgi:hypothetical protein
MVIQPGRSAGAPRGRWRRRNARAPPDAARSAAGRGARALRRRRRRGARGRAPAAGSTVAGPPSRGRRRRRARQARARGGGRGARGSTARARARLGRCARARCARARYAAARRRVRRHAAAVAAAAGAPNAQIQAPAPGSLSGLPGKGAGGADWGQGAGMRGGRETGPVATAARHRRWGGLWGRGGMHLTAWGGHTIRGYGGRARGARRGLPFWVLW